MPSFKLPFYAWVIRNGRCEKLSHEAFVVISSFRPLPLSCPWQPFQWSSISPPIIQRKETDDCNFREFHSTEGKMTQSANKMMAWMQNQSRIHWGVKQLPTRRGEEPIHRCCPRTWNDRWVWPRGSQLAHRNGFDLASHRVTDKDGRRIFSQGTIWDQSHIPLLRRAGLEPLMGRYTHGFPSLARLKHWNLITSHSWVWYSWPMTSEPFMSHS